MTDSVKIIHDEETKLDFVFLAEFLRFIGIMVGEDISREYFVREGRPDEEDAEIFSCFIYMGEPSFAQVLRKLPLNTIDFSAICAQVLPEGWKPCIAQLNSVDQQKVLLACLEEIYCAGAAAPEAAREGERGGTAQSAGKIKVNPKLRIKISQLVNGLNALAGIYLKNKIMLYSANIQYYPTKPSFVMDEARKAFIDTYNHLSAMEANYPEDKLLRRHYEYARLWCGVKTNCTCSYSQKLLYFTLENLARGCRELEERYPDFYNARVLLGMCYDASPPNARDALSAFGSALQVIQVPDCVAAIYYWIGKKNEAYKEAAHAEENYRKSYEAKKKFRNIYKLAIIEKDKKNYKLANEYYDEIIAKLHRRITLNFADPLELEYAFKVNAHACYLNYKRGFNTIGRAIEYGEMAETVVKEYVKGDQYYDSLYGTDAQRYRELSCRRMGLDNVYKILSAAWCDRLDTEKSQMYLDKLSAIKGGGAG